ncbi:MAG: DUF6600 domain-containing protein [Acidobacteriota bacterium]
MTNVRRVSLWVLPVLLCLPSAGFSQPPSTSLSAQEPAQPSVSAPPPAHISLVEGQVFLERESRSEAAVENVPLLDGDRIRTEQGRIEVILPDGSLLHLDRDTIMDALAPDLWRLLQGRAYLIVLGARDPSRSVRYQIDAPAASVQTDGPGEYRLLAVNQTAATQLELAVIRGSATLANEQGSVGARAGERVVAREGLAPNAPQYFNSARSDTFDRWSAERRDERTGTASVQYLPADLEPYAGTLDRYGSWRYEPSSGYVWYPTVQAGWRPYSAGYWQSYDTWGSFWIGSDPWGWPTHHYGRWGFSGSLGWYWMPGRAFGAAWVYWATAPGYVGWCALGRNDYPVFGHWGVRGVYAGRHDAWYGWTVLPQRHFGAAVHVGRVTVDGRSLNLGRTTFMARPTAPITGYAVARGRSSGRAMPRFQATPGPGGAQSRQFSSSPRSPNVSPGGARPRFGGPGDVAGGGRVFGGQDRSAGNAGPRATGRDISGPAGARTFGTAPQAQPFARRSIPGAEPREARPDIRSSTAPGVRDRQQSVQPRRAWPTQANASTITDTGRAGTAPESVRSSPRNDGPSGIERRSQSWQAPRQPAQRGYSQNEVPRYSPGARTPSADRGSSSGDHGWTRQPDRAAPRVAPSAPPDSGGSSRSQPRYNPGAASPRSSGGTGRTPSQPQQQRRRGGVPD